METLERWIDRAILIMVAVAGVGLVAMMIHVTADVLMRYFFNHPIRDTIETASYYYMILIVFLPLAFVERKSEHIEVELFVQFLGTRLRNVFYVAGRLFSIIFFSILTYASWVDAVDYARIRETPMGSNLEIWPSRFALPIGFGLLVLAMALHAAKALMHLQQVRPQGDGPAYAREDQP
jgi:TRAP-type C4-dicarboxylate transport system permease small subunit